MCDINDSQQGDSLTVIPFDPLDPKGSKYQALSRKAHKQRRRVTTEEDKANIRVVKATGPCWRCKILKKQCDGEQPCKQCPAQSYDSPHDHWRVLGCRRGDIASLVEIFIPVWLERDHRSVRDLQGCQWQLVQTKKPSRADIHTFQWMEALPALLERDLTSRSCCSHRILNLEESLQAILVLLELRNLDIASEGTTEYKIFDLLFNISHAEAHRIFTRTVDGTFNTWQLSRKIIIGACEYYDRELQYSQRFSSVRHFHSADTYCFHRTTIYVDVRQYSFSTLKKDLKLGLEIFEKVCLKRKSLDYWQWLSMFYLLNAISIVKSIIVDTHVRGCSYGGSPFQEGHAATAVQSAYNALVGIFGWAAGSFDPMRGPVKLPTTRYGVFVGYAEAIHKELCDLVHVNRWNLQNIRSTKDFLVGLGTRRFLDGIYNGYVVQNKGLQRESGIAEAEVGSPENFLDHSSMSDVVTDNSNAIKMTEAPTGAPMSFWFRAPSSSENAMTDIETQLLSLPSTSSLEPYKSRMSTENVFIEEEYESFVAQEIGHVFGRIKVVDSNTCDSAKMLSKKSGKRTSSQATSSPLNYPRRTMLGRLSSEPETMGKPVEHRNGRIQELENYKLGHSEMEIRSSSNSTTKVNLCNIFAGNKPASPRSTLSSLGSGGSPMSICSLIKEDVTTSELYPSPSSWRSLSSSNQSAASLRKVEANFLRDIKCCGKPFATFHDLRAHYDSAHGQSPGRKTASAIHLGSVENVRGDLRNAMLTDVATISP